MTYRPAFQKQLVSTDPMGGISCTFYSGAMALDRDTHGKIVMTGKRLRSLQSDQEGGASILRVKEAYASPAIKGLALAAGIRPSPTLIVSNISFPALLEYLRAGRGAVLAIQYRIVRDSWPAYRGSTTFGGSHTIYVNEARANGDCFVYDPLADGRRTGIAKGPQWWPVSLVRAVAQDVRDENGNRFLPDGYARVGLTRDTEPAPVVIAPAPAPTPAPAPAPVEDYTVIVDRTPYPPGTSYKVLPAGQEIHVITWDSSMGAEGKRDVLQAAGQTGLADHGVYITREAGDTRKPSGKWVHCTSGSFAGRYVFAGDVTVTQPPVAATPAPDMSSIRAAITAALDGAKADVLASIEKAGAA